MGKQWNLQKGGFKKKKREMIQGVPKITWTILETDRQVSFLDLVQSFFKNFPKLQTLSNAGVGSEGLISDFCL